MESEISTEQISSLQNLLLEWFAQKGRNNLPWKLNAEGRLPKPQEYLDPYKIWIAEIMLQQTQLKVVLPFWERWMEAFPSITHLAAANQEEVLLIWQGLGYYSRAKRILISSKILLEIIGSSNVEDPQLWPKKIETWIALPGVGRSTAGSIISSAFNIYAPILDGNVKRVLSRLIASSKVKNDLVHQLWRISESLLHERYPRDFNQALMDLGAIICVPIKPFCQECPWNHFCLAYSYNKAAQFPSKIQNKPLDQQIIGVGIVLNHLGEVLIDQRLEEGLLGGMWEFPGGKQESSETIQETISRELKEELNIDVQVEQLLIAFDHAYSHKRLHFVVHICKLIKGEPSPLACQQVKWVRPSELSMFPFPAANTKMIQELRKFLKKHNMHEL